MDIADVMGPAPKRRRAKSISAPKRKQKAKAAEAETAVNIVLADEDTEKPAGPGIIVGADGSVTVDFGPPPAKETKHDDNLAEKLDESQLGVIAEDLLEGIASDDESRREWLETRARGMELLGLKLEDPKSSGASAPVEGMSVVRHPLLLEAVLRFQANARGELLPSNGPVKIRVDGDPSTATDIAARALERDLNHYLTVTASEYYEDTDRMLLMVGFGGSAFKKVYNCPLRRRPVSESVDASDLIVSNTATDIKNASRVTHRVRMRQSVMKRMQIVGEYRDVDIGEALSMPNAIDQKVGEIQGTAAASSRPEDQDREVYECYCEIDLPGFEHKLNKKKTGLPLPYVVTIDRESRRILAIRRNWDEDDKDCCAKQRIVHYKFVPGFGFYGIGLVHILGNSTNALTAAWREMLDAGMFANFPGFLYAKSSARQTSNVFRIAPGSGAAIDTGGQPITQMVMPLPYKEAGPGMIQLVKDITETGTRVGGTSEANVAEGKQEAPVGTTLALIEQASKMMSAVHKRMHAAQAEEFRKLRDEFQADPSALWRGNKRAAKRWDEAKFKAALEMYELVPCADPNTPSQMHRLMKATAVKQMAQLNPQMYDMRKVDAHVFAMADMGDPNSMFAPPQPPAGPDPAIMAAMELKKADIAFKEKKLAVDKVQKEKDRKTKENLAVLELGERLATHPESYGIVNEQLGRMAPFMHQPGAN